MPNDLLAPAAVLLAWTLVMLFWMAFTRLPAMHRAGYDLRQPRPGGRRGADLEGVLPDSVNWVAHNYNHLHEQPTLFYAAIAILAISGSYGALAPGLAWAYVGLRVAHSLVQATVNYVPLRFALFGFSSLCLLGLVVAALRATLFA